MIKWSGSALKFHPRPYSFDCSVPLTVKVNVPNEWNELPQKTIAYHLFPPSARLLSNAAICCRFSNLQCRSLRLYIIETNTRLGDFLSGCDAVCFHIVTRCVEERFNLPLH